ncbi:hypothetical protein F4824DRAFT_390608 [Ustulina deusta]|nr:hypothetical protein F4824DRAFT_390608 [Ustulina deusta]
MRSPSSIGSAIALLSLIPSTTPHNINLVPRIPPLPPSLSPSPSPSPQPCSDPNAAKSFAFRSIYYLRYEASPSAASSPQPNTTQLVFELDNASTGVSTGCACQNVMSAGAWADDSRTWYACVDRVLTVGGAQHPVKTSALVDWDRWRLTVNQTWACEER